MTANNLDEMISPRGISTIAWFLIGAGFWALGSIPLEQWLLGSETLPTAFHQTFFYKLFIVTRALPEYHPLLIFLALLMIASGVGLLKSRPWGRTFTFAFIASAAIGNTILLVRLLRTVGVSELKGPFLLTWLMGTVFLAGLGVYVNRLMNGAPAVFQMATVRAAQWYDVVLHSAVKVFGVTAVLVGLALGIWGISLILQPSASMSIDGIPTNALLPKLGIVAFSSIVFVIGAACLFVKRKDRGRAK